MRFPRESSREATMESNGHLDWTGGAGVSRREQELRQWLVNER